MYGSKFRRINLFKDLLILTHSVRYIQGAYFKVVVPSILKQRKIIYLSHIRISCSMFTHLVELKIYKL